MKHRTTYYVLRYNLRPDGALKHKEWLAGQGRAGSRCRGWTYVGTFFDIMGFGRYDYETRWELNGSGSISSRPLDAATEQRLRDRLPFIADGQVGILQAQGGCAPRAH